MPRILRINHIGLAVQDQAASRFWQALGLPLAGEEAVPSDAVTAGFFPVGESRIELLTPLGDDGPVQKFLANRGEGLHHICFDVEDICGLLTQLAAAGVELIDPEARHGAEGSLVAFIHPRAAHGVLIELREAAPTRPPTEAVVGPA